MNIIINYDSGDVEVIANISRLKISEYKIFLKLEDGKKEMIKIFDKKANGKIEIVKTVFADTSSIFNLYSLEHNRNLSALEEEDKKMIKT